MHIHWAAFGEVLVVSLGVAVGIIALFAVGVALLSPAAPSPDGTHLTVASAAGRGTAQGRATRSRAAISREVTAWLCFLVCALAVAYGLYMIVRR